jgi:hypothetical protein
MAEAENDLVERRRRVLISRFGVKSVFPDVPEDPVRRLDADLVRLHASLFAIASTVSRPVLRSLSRAEGAPAPNGLPEEERIYGRVTALAGADFAPQRVLRLAYVPAQEKAPSKDLLAFMEPVRPRGDDADAAFWLPLAAIRAGEISIANIDSSRYDWPLVRYSIVDGALAAYPV